MKLKNILSALAFGMACSSASATVLSFDQLTELMYGDSFPLLPSMSYNGQSLNYLEAGFQVSLHTPNAALGVAHIGDGTFESQTYNWHGGFDNGWDSFVTLTRADGGLFNLIGFDYLADWSLVSVDGNQVGFLEGEGSWSTRLNGITELRLSSGDFNRIDNINVEQANALPLPGTLSLLLGGLAAGGVLRRHRRQR